MTEPDHIREHWWSDDRHKVEVDEACAKAGEEMRERAAKAVEAMPIQITRGNTRETRTCKDAAAAIRALPLAPPGTEPATETGDERSAWVIEQGGSLASHPWYFAGEPDNEWSDDHLKAIRFCREIDAKNAAWSLPTMRPRIHRVCEHIWIGGDPHTVASRPDKSQPVPADVSGRATLADEAERLLGDIDVFFCEEFLKDAQADFGSSAAQALAGFRKLKARATAPASPAREKAIEALRLAPVPEGVGNDTVYFHWYRDDRADALAALLCEGAPE